VCSIYPEGFASRVFAKFLSSKTLHDRLTRMPIEMTNELLSKGNLTLTNPLEMRNL
jgi:hypothetical protein